MIVTQAYHSVKQKIHVIWGNAIIRYMPHVHAYTWLSQGCHKVVHTLSQLLQGGNNLGNGVSEVDCTCILLCNNLYYLHLCIETTG